MNVYFLNLLRDQVVMVGRGPIDWPLAIGCSTASRLCSLASAR